MSTSSGKVRYRYQKYIANMYEQHRNGKHALFLSILEYYVIYYAVPIDDFIAQQLQTPAKTHSLPHDAHIIVELREPENRMNLVRYFPDFKSEAIAAAIANTETRF